ncbi:hypothetical protein [Actinomadura madurae]|uniref:Uncharacterized protein n=1 Tax=Actinomadura madurae TaxID=1993 RepID=A0A1I5WNP1_9ACTN|nr:hypothetical protein [Actinomadura madurae]SFQ21432.1 hypothetical protein SAMN04489713_12460 [Actinomadura madurae]SPT51783.1 Uncharacterised protein [Actinomadura madurae]
MNSPTDVVGASQQPWSGAAGEPGPAGGQGPYEPGLVAGAARPGALSSERPPGGTSAVAARSWTAPSRREPLAELAERVAEKAMACPDVLGLTAGPRGWIVTYRVGPPFAGVAVHEAVIEVGVVVRYGRPFAEIAEDVRRLVSPLAGRRTVDVLIGDVADGG